MTQSKHVAPQGVSEHVLDARQTRLDHQALSLIFGVAVRVSRRSALVNLQNRIRPGSAGAYAFAIVLVVIASFARWGLGFITEDIQGFATFYPAVLFASLIGGPAVGTFAAVLGALVSLWAFLPPYFSFQLETLGQQISLASYIFSSLLIVWAAEHYRSLTNRLRDEEKFRKLAVEELAHRLKNKLATIQSIVRFRLREHPEAKTEIISALDALSAADDLIMAAQGQGASVRDILSAEFEPYDVSRISMEGPDCVLPPKLALAMALVVHELVTNAAKYGALSNSLGTLVIRWSVFDVQLKLEWRESGGPPVTPPTYRGFGTRLLSNSLDQFGGSVEMAFETSGLVCRLTVMLSQRTPGIVPLSTSKNSEVLVAD